MFYGAVAAVLAAVLLPAVFDSSFPLLAPASLAFYALLLLYGVMMTVGAGWAQRQLPQYWAWPYFGLHLLVFGTAQVLPVPHDVVWILSMPVVSLAFGALPPTRAALVPLGYLLFFGVFLHWVGLPTPRVVSTMLSLGVGMLFTVGCTLLAAWANRCRATAEKLARELEAANAELRDSAARTVALATAQERNRIARDIHDGLGHYLTVVAVQLQAARALLPAQPERASDALAKAEQAARTALDDVRRSVGTLRDTSPLPPLRVALEGLLRESGLAAMLDCAGQPRPLPAAAEQALFRTVQEALTNVRKHAGTSRARVCLDLRDPSRVSIEIADEGCGRGPAAPGGGFGLAGLSERLAAIGGTLKAGNRDGGGFVVRAEVRT